ncbi:hypothetical protein [Asaia astilbis]|uniref:hypothetical protein n=1 Tax=Asaia astilbis TaxID=610244 RepID=UPI0004710791|nr:hypothetical protein [Asaia astilbis]
MTTAPPPVSRTLMAAVIIMGALIVLGTAGLIGVVAHRALSGKHKQSVEMTQPVLTGEAPQFALSGSGHIVSETVRPDGTLAVQITDTDRDRIVIWNPEANRITAEFTLKH